MRQLLLCAALSIVVMCPGVSVSDVIIVDAGGAGHYLTIQEGVDAAANLDTVLVLPGFYNDVHQTPVGYDYVYVNAYFEKNITLVSSAGPTQTLVDGQGVATYGIGASPDPVVGSTLPPPVVEGFTVLNGAAPTSWESAAIVAFESEARGNICMGYGSGLASDFYNPPTGVPGGIRGRNGGSLIVGNLAHSNQYGIWLREGGSYVIEGTVSGNTVHYNFIGIGVGSYFDWTGGVELIDNIVQNNEIGIELLAPSLSTSSATLVGNTVSHNTQGVYVSNYGSSISTGSIEVSLEENQVFYNTTSNLKVSCGSDYGDCRVDMAVGGSLEAANDFFGAPCNVLATQEEGGEIHIDASYNYWGSTECNDFVPLFCLEGMPDTAFVFLPFTDGTHTVVFPDCGSIVTTPGTWGGIKALFK